jgi:hypothetical protein
MRVFVNNQEVPLLPGMTVRHALIGEGLLDEVMTGKKRTMNGGTRSALTAHLQKEAGSA